MRPGLQGEGRSTIEERRSRNGQLRSVAEDEGRDHVSLIGEDQMRAGFLMKVGNTPADKSEVRALQIG